MKLIVVVLGLLAAPAMAQDNENNWHLMTQSFGGAVSLLHNLDKKTCEFSRKRALGLPATEQEEVAERKHNEVAFGATCPPNGASGDDWKKWQSEHPWATGCRFADGNGGSSWGGGHMVSNGDITKAECFQ